MNEEQHHQPGQSKTDAAIARLRSTVAKLSVGSRIPSERDLAKDWGVARMTARKALEVLVAEGLLERRPGSGSFVAEVPHARMQGLSSFSADMQRRGHQPSSQLLDFERLDAPAIPARRLSLADGAPIIRFTRLRLADDEPIAVETTWMPDSLVPSLTEADLDGSLFDTLLTKFDITPGQASSTIDCINADAEVAKQLDLAPGAACLRVQMNYLDARRRPLMAATCLYRGDRYELHAVLTPNAVASEGGPT